jgi:hypothetical protein
MAGKTPRLSESEINRVIKEVKEQGLDYTGIDFDFSNGKVIVTRGGNSPEVKASKPLDRVLRDDYHPA